MATATQDLNDQFRYSRQFFHLITGKRAEIIHANELFKERIAPVLPYLHGQEMGDFIPGDEKEKLSLLLNRICTNEESMYGFVSRHVHHGIEFLKICWEITPVKSNGQPTGYLQWIGIEEHQSKEVFEEMGRNLVEIREQFDAYEYSAEGIWKVELREPMPIDLPADQILHHWKMLGVITYCNDKFAVMYGLPGARSVVGRPVTETMDLDDPRLLSYFQHLIQNNFRSSGLETMRVSPGGEITYFLHNVICIIEDGMILRAWGTVLDITRLRKTEAKLQKSEEFYRSLVTVSLDGILLTREDGMITFCSNSVRRILDFGAEILEGRNFIDFVHPHDQPPARMVFAKGKDSDILHDFVNLRLLHHSGEWIWCMVRVYSQLNNPLIGRVIIYFSDNSLRKQAEDALIASEQRFRKLLDNLSVGVLLLDSEGAIVVSNNMALELLGLTEENLIGRKVIVGYDVLHEDGSRFDPSDFPVAQALRKKKSVKNVVMGVGRPSLGDRVWLLVNATPVLDEEGVVQTVIASYANITEHRDLTQKLTEQEILRQKQLLQVTIDAQERERREIGRELHDNISQHLTMTRLHLEMIREKADGELLDFINIAHRSLLSIVNEIRMLSHSLVPPSINDIGLVASVQDLCDNLNNSSSYTIDLRVDEFDEDQLPENMKLMIYRIIQEQVNNVLRHSGASQLFISLQIIEDSVMLLVEDNGKGFDPATVKKGMGFLNISNRVGLFNGSVRIGSEPGKGCMLEVEIPLARN